MVDVAMPRSFELVDAAALPPDPIAGEEALLVSASDGHAVAHLWEAPVSLVVPRSYRRHERLDEACERFAAQGCPVHLRMSGGGLVPLGPGILNLSLAWQPCSGTPGECAEPVYRFICALLKYALRELGVQAHWQAVESSFCDGRFNLAVGDGDSARKIAGTAQYWRPLSGTMPRRYAVLAHAVLLVGADLEEANARANAFEAMLGSGRSYDAAKIANALQEVREAAAPVEAGRTMDRVRGALLRQLEVAPLP
jgi:lipoate-protein ligase A